MQLSLQTLINNKNIPELQTFIDEYKEINGASQNNYSDNNDEIEDEIEYIYYDNIIKFLNNYYKKENVTFKYITKEVNGIIKEISIETNKDIPNLINQIKITVQQLIELE